MIAFDEVEWTANIILEADYNQIGDGEAEEEEMDDLDKRLSYQLQKM